MVLIRVAGGDWHEPATTSFSLEKELQSLVKLSPTLLPGTQPLAVVDELWIPGVGFVDLVGVGSDGQIVIVECKLKANPEIRREVVGQVLAYAGGIWRMSYDEFQSAFEQRAGTGLYEAVKAATSTQLDEPELRAAVTANLSEGAFRLVVAVDQITAELRTIIEFLNSHTLAAVQVQALELDYSKDGDVELLQPVVYGVEAPKKSVGNPTKWTLTTFGEQVEAKHYSPEHRAVVTTLLDHVISRGTAKGGTGVTPAMSGLYPVGGTTVSLWSIYLNDKEPVVTINLGPIASKVSDAAAFQWLTNLSADPALAPHLAHVSSTNLQKWPSVKAGVFTPDVLKHLLTTIDGIL